jgi:hypothetical protein
MIKVVGVFYLAVTEHGVPAGHVEEWKIWHDP